MIILMCLLLGTHLYFTFRTGFIQRKIPYAVRLSLKPQKKGEDTISPFSALATALAATIGTGNIIGVSTAVAVGGPGAVFWCWLTGVLGIATCYAECYLSVRYRIAGRDGTFRGGPMYVMENRMHQRSGAVLFSAAVILVSLGMGSSIQSASIRTAVLQLFPQSGQHHWAVMRHVVTFPQIIGVATAILTGIVILGGAKQITKVCTWLVPFMSLFYFSGCVYLIWMNKEVFMQTLGVIIGSAFSSRSFLGGCAGTAVYIGIRTGLARGLFTNEAGMGSIPMTAASAEVKEPSRQALVSMTGPFWDTVVMCAITGIALVSCAVKENSFYSNIESDKWCFAAFAQLPFAGEELLSVSLILFAFATIIGWNYYGICAVRYLFEEKGVLLYQILYMAAVYCGTVLEMDLLWKASDFFNLAMAIPNLICLWTLRKEIGGSNHKMCGYGIWRKEDTDRK